MKKELGEQDALNPVNADKFPKLAKATELAQNYRVRAERAERKIKELKAGVKPPKKSKGAGKSPKNEPTEGLDYGQKAYLKASGLASDEYDLVQDWVSNTGKDIEEILENRFFKAELAEHREHKASDDAVPSSTGRSGKLAKDTVDYWVAKGEMPPADQPMLRREYVNAKIKKNTDGSKFTDMPVAKY